MSRRIRILMVAVCLVLAACGGPKTPTTRQAPSVTPSGFLPNYAELTPGGPGRALLVYKAPDANVAAYNQVLLDPVTVWRAQTSQDVSRADLQHLADLLYGSLMVQLQNYYVMVKKPEPHTLRIRAALTEATPSSTTMDVMSQVGPISHAAGEAKQMASGTPAWVGAASAEIEVLDAQTGKELFAAADRRVGEKTLTGSTQPWDDVKETFRVWSEAVVARLQAEGGPTQPVPWWAQPHR